MVPKYNGVIKKSRTYDLAALSQTIDAVVPIFILYSPEQIGVAVPVYMGIRMALNGLAAWLRSKTTGPVGEK